MAKEKIICDTDVMIDYWDQTKSRHKATVNALEKSIGLDNVLLSAVTKMELMMGATNKSELAKISKQLERFNIALINNEITLLVIELIHTYKLSHGISFPDGLIAATAIITEVELYTYNTKDFKFINKLKLFTP